MWKTPPADVTLTGTDVHIWRATLDLDTTTTQAFRDILTADEAMRADRFHFPRDRTRFVVARGVLRVILGDYLRINPADIRFEYNPYGKPAIAQPCARSFVHFNLSHADDTALYAFAIEREVGVDIEEVRTDLPYVEIADRTFSSAERAAFKQLPAALQPQGFFNCWTRKEAYIKARGMGLSMPLDQFDVSLIPGAPAALLRTAEEPKAVHRWSLLDIAVGSRFAAAVVTEGRDWQVSYWQFEQTRWLMSRSLSAE